MTRASIIAFTAFIWTAGFAATGTLYAVTKMPSGNVSTVSVTAPTAPTAQSYRLPEVRFIELPTVEIVSSLPRVVRKTEPATATVAPPTEKHHCSDWHPLEQGSSSVQICD